MKEAVCCGQGQEMKRHIHYEAAFEDYLRSRGVPYVPVEESKRAVFAGERVKSFDFIVYPSNDLRWLVDVKGRRFPYITEHGSRRYWENWVTQEDLDGLTEWQSVFGGDFEARLVFAYLLEGPPDRWPTLRPHRFRGEDYAFVTVRLDEYRRQARPRSPSWETVSMSMRAFRRICQPLELAGTPPPGPTCQARP
jgi:hypothetical protein